MIWKKRPTETDIAALSSKIRNVTSGSMHDIRQSGLYYLTDGVTDKPTGNGGYYSVTAYSNLLLVGLFSNTDGLTYNIIFANNQWYTNQLVKQSNMTPAKVPLTVNDAYVSTTGRRIECYKSGNVATIIFDATFTSAITNLTNVASGFPAPITPVLLNLIDNSGQGARLYLNGSGTLQTNYGKVPTAQFYSGTVSYVMA